MAQIVESGMPFTRVEVLATRHSKLREAAHLMQPRLIAYVVGDKYAIEPGTQKRVWMDETPDRFAKRCLPLLIANQMGWTILNPRSFTAIWNGHPTTDGISIDTGSVTGRAPVDSHFGSGILTWRLPFLFRTPMNYQLWVKGPANDPKDAISPLEGIVETGWSMATFTMNWKFTRPHTPISFLEGEPFCTIVPQQVQKLEAFEAQYVEIESAPDETCRLYKEFAEGRERFNVALNDEKSTAREERWQKHYFQGTNADGTRASQHWTKLRLNAFARFSENEMSANESAAPTEVSHES